MTCTTISCVCSRRSAALRSSCARRRASSQCGRPAGRGGRRGRWSSCRWGGGGVGQGIHTYCPGASVYPPPLLLHCAATTLFLLTILLRIHCVATLLHPRPPPVTTKRCLLCLPDFSRSPVSSCLSVACRSCSGRRTEPRQRRPRRAGRRSGGWQRQSTALRSSRWGGGGPGKREGRRRG